MERRLSSTISVPSTSRLSIYNDESSENYPGNEFEAIAIFFNENVRVTNGSQIKDTKLIERWNSFLSKKVQQHNWPNFALSMSTEDFRKKATTMLAAFKGHESKLKGFEKLKLVRNSFISKAECKMYKKGWFLNLELLDTNDQIEVPQQQIINENVNLQNTTFQTNERRESLNSTSLSPENSSYFSHNRSQMANQMNSFERNVSNYTQHQSESREFIRNRRKDDFDNTYNSSRNRNQWERNNQWDRNNQWNRSNEWDSWVPNTNSHYIHSSWRQKEIETQNSSSKRGRNDTYFDSSTFVVPLTSSVLSTNAIQRVDTNEETEFINVDDDIFDTLEDNIPALESHSHSTDHSAYDPTILAIISEPPVDFEQYCTDQQRKSDSRRNRTK